MDYNSRSQIGRCDRSRYEYLQGDPLRGTQWHSGECSPFADTPSVSLSPQNFSVAHGKNYYMKGVFSSGLQADVADKLVSRLPQLCAESGINFTVVYECIPMSKILTVPNHATAHIRGPRLNVLILATWDSQDTNILDTVRNAANELGRILLQGEKIIPESLNVGYGNYSKHRGERIRNCAQVLLDPEYIESAVVGSSGSKVNAQTFFGENYARLQKLKQEYDPDLVFFKWCPITPQA